LSVDELTDQLDIPPLDRQSLYQYLDLISVMEPETEILMRERAEKNLREDDHDSPHEKAWYLSFHASGFPGDFSDACARQLVYRMMNIPTARGSIDPWIEATGVVGKAIELDIADAWFRGGRMLGIPEDPTKPNQYQLGFRDPQHWLTGSTDLAILPPFWTKSHIVELKGKDQAVLDEMLYGRLLDRDGVLVTEPRKPDDAHVRQLKATLGLAHEYDWGEVVVCKYSWRILWSEVVMKLRPDGRKPQSGLVLGRDDHNKCPEHDYDCQYAFKLEPPTTGEIRYCSRSWPMGHPKHGQCRKSFFFDYDPAYMERGRSVLKEAKEHFENGTLPSRPKHMQWSVTPCNWCQAKPFCRLDEGIEPRKRKPTKEPVKLLTDSNGIEHARTIRPGYKYELTREKVFAEWRENK
jgi:hypothetical protein